MPISRKVQEAGNFFNDDEVALLGRVFDAAKLDADTELQREARASRIIANYMAGITDEEELVSLSRKSLGR